MRKPLVDPFGRPLPLAGAAGSASDVSCSSAGAGIVILPLRVGMMFAERQKAEPEKRDQHATLKPNAIYNMEFKPEPKPKLVPPAAQVLHVVWLVQPVVIHGSLAGPACRPSAHLAGCRNIKESFLSLAGSACRLEVPDDDRKR